MIGKNDAQREESDYSIRLKGNCRFGSSARPELSESKKAKEEGAQRGWHLDSGVPREDNEARDVVLIVLDVMVKGIQAVQLPRPRTGHSCSVPACLPSQSSNMRPPPPHAQSHPMSY